MYLIFTIEIVGRPFRSITGITMIQARCFVTVANRFFSLSEKDPPVILYNALVTPLYHLKEIQKCPYYV